MPTEKKKKPVQKVQTKPSAAKAVAASGKVSNGKSSNGKVSNGKAARAEAHPAAPLQRTPPAPDPKSDAKLQYKAFDSGIQLLNGRRFREARDMFGKAAGGPNLEISSNARLHVRMCERRLAAAPPAPKSAEDHYNYGVFLINMRKLAEARNHLAMALAIDSAADHVHYALGVCLALSGDAAGAYDSLKRAIELQPRNRMVAIQDSDLDAISSQPRINRLLYPERNS
jgi:tetratricopeptide (TPR) repeat protein